MTLTAAEVWRNYEIDGVPSSGPHQPDKADIRGWGSLFETLLNGGSPGLAYASTIALNVDLAHAAGVTALVYGDLPASNGVYVKTGVSGSGTWVRIGDLPNSIVRLTVTGGTANAIVATATETPSVPGSKLYLLTPNAANTAATTIAVNGASPAPINNAFGLDLAPNSLISASQVLMAWSVDHYQLLIAAGVDGNAILANVLAAQAAAQGYATAAASSASALANQVHQYDTLAQAIAATIPSGVNLVRLGGRTTAGDLGGRGALYKRASAPSGAAPLWYWQNTASSSWWILSETEVSPGMFGAVGDGSTDDSAALQAMFNFIGTLPAANLLGCYPANGQGKTYATSLPLSLSSYVDLSDITLKALTGSSWSGAAGFLTYGTNGVLTIVNVGFVRLRNVQVDANRIASVQCIYASGPNYSNVFDTVFCKHWSTNGNGIILNNFSLTSGNNLDCLQWLDGDAEYGLPAYRSGMAMGMFSNADSIITNSNFANSLVQLFIDRNCHHNRFVSIHPYQVSVGSATANPYGVIYDGYGNTFHNMYLDVVPFLIRTDSSTVIGRPQLTVTGTVGLYNPAISTFASWFQFTTSVSNTPIFGIILRDNILPNISPFSFVMTGSGSWLLSSVALTQLNGAVGDAAIMEPGGGTQEFVTNLNLLGLGKLQGYLNQVNATAAGVYTLSSDDSGTLLLMTISGGSTIIAPATITTSIGVKFVLTNHAGSIQAGSGGTINGLTSAISLSQNKLYEIVWISGSGANAQYALMGSGI